MSIQCIALDLDRTTLNGEGRLSPGNRQALEYAIGKASISSSPAAVLSPACRRM